MSWDTRNYYIDAYTDSMFCRGAARGNITARNQSLLEANHDEWDVRLQAAKDWEIMMYEDAKRVG